MRLKLVAVAIVVMLGSSCAWLARVNVSSSGDQANSGTSARPAVSADGRYVVFSTYADNLVEGDTNGKQDIFRRDTRDGSTVRVSMSSDGEQSNDYSSGGSISADGRYVVFLSRATNLVDNPGPNAQAYLWDALTETTTLVSVASDGAPSNWSNLNATISANGRFVVFNSMATNLVPHDTNGERDEFVHDTMTGSTIRVSVADDGTQSAGTSYGATISGDGTKVAFVSNGSDLVAGDTNGANDVFVRDLVAGTTTRVSVATDGRQADAHSGEGFAQISADGTAVAFGSHAGNLVPGDTNGTRDVFVHDIASATTDRVSVSSDDIEGNDGSRDPSISADGRFVAFTTSATTLLSDDENGDAADVVVRDRVHETTRLVAADPFGNPPAWGASSSAISADGRYVVFASTDQDLLPPDSNPSGFDVYIKATPGAEGLQVTPATLQAGHTTTVTVSGRNFSTDLIATFGPGTNIVGRTDFSSDRIELEVEVHPQAEPGPRSLVLIRPGTGPGPQAIAASTCHHCVEVTAPN